MRKFREKFLGPRSVTQTLCEPAQSKDVKMRLDISQEPLCRNLQVKCRGPEPGTTLCARLCDRNAFQHCTSKSHFIRKFPEI